MGDDLRQYAAGSTVRLTTTGRKSGRQHTVTIWFVVIDADRFYVQHVRGRAQWYKNALKIPEVLVDFGPGPRPGRLRPIDDPREIKRVLAMFRRKYLLAWLVQLLGIRQQPVAAIVEC
jgi:deazaflavin-dependent oxidoreductase (nitroreductase family)